MLAWLLIPAAIGFAIAFAGFDHPLLGPPPASQPGNSVRSVRDDPAVSERQEWVEETRRAAMQDVAKASSEAERQHDRAMKAVEAARALAENPDSANAREALDRAMADIAKGDQSSLPPDRADWTAEDYARAMREGRSLTD